MSLDIQTGGREPGLGRSCRGPPRLCAFPLWLCICLGTEVGDRGRGQRWRSVCHPQVGRDGTHTLSPPHPCPCQLSHALTDRFFPNIFVWELPDRQKSCRAWRAIAGISTGTLRPRATTTAGAHLRASVSPAINPSHFKKCISNYGYGCASEYLIFPLQLVPLRGFRSSPVLRKLAGVPVTLSPKLSAFLLSSGGWPSGCPVRLGCLSSMGMKVRAQVRGAGRPPSVLQHVGPAPQGKGPGLSAGLARASRGPGAGVSVRSGSRLGSPRLQDGVMRWSFRVWAPPCTAWVGAGHTAPQAGVRHRDCRVCRGEDRAGGHSGGLHALPRLAASAGSSLSFSVPSPGMARVAQAGSSEVGGPDVAQPISGCPPPPVPWS